MAFVRNCLARGDANKIICVLTHQLLLCSIPKPRLLCRLMQLVRTSFNDHAVSWSVAVVEYYTTRLRLTTVTWLHLKLLQSHHNRTIHLEVINPLSNRL
jgi:hypothetical protein